MKRNLTLLACLFLLLGTSSLYAAYTAPEADKVYRIYNVNSEKVIGEDCIARLLSSVDAAGNDDFKQLWLLKKSGNGYLIQNAYSGQYMQHCAQTSTTYPTGAEEATMYFTQVSGTQYAIGQTTGAYLHLDAGNNIVRWWDKDNTSSQWQFEEVQVSAEAISLQQAAFKEYYAEYQAKLELMEHIDEYNALLPTFFADTACTELQAAYASMSDDELRSAMNALPTTLQDMAVKIKNKAWGHREEEFRIRSYKAYSDADYWGDVLYTKKYSRINNPTGIYGQAGDVLYIFVGNDIPEGATLEAEVISGSGIQGKAYGLKKGLNMVPTVQDYSNIFIQYVGETSMESDVLITDYPELKIHIEQGVVNGFWNKEEHDDADWVDMMTNLATADVFQVKGERMMFHMSRYYMKMYCPNTISDAIGWWDDMTRWQQDMLGIEDVRLTKFNNLGCAISLTSGYQSATHYRTQYLDSYIVNLLPYERMMSNADNCWGPAHENGHVHQAAIQSVGTSEVSNNFFSNLTLNKLGKYISRGDANDVIFNDYAAHTPYILRGGATTMRSFWQLYLYFHEAKADTTFYPRVFQAMRATPMKARDPKYYANYVYGNEDLLLFAKACCDAAQLDLSEFFRFWGYLEITDKQHIGDYGDFYLTTRQKDVDEFLAHASQYPKAPSIIFIEDRVKPIPRTDGGTGNKLHHGAAIQVGSAAGDVGHYTDFMDTTVKAEGYIYDKDGVTITISNGTGAVGFKVYTRTDSTLIYGSNRYTFKIPKEYEMSDIFVVAAQADGTDAPVKSLAEGGTESQQLEILKETLALAKEYAAKSDATGTKIGFFKPDSVVVLNELISKIENVIQNNDQSEQTYGAWAIQLNTAITTLHGNHEARIPFMPECFYSIVLCSNANRYMGTVAAGLNTTVLTDATDNVQWRIVPGETAETCYLQNRETGNYITVMQQGQRAKAASSDIAEAVAFKLIPDAPGEFFIQHAETADLNLYNNGSNNRVLAGEQTGNSAKWMLHLEESLLAQPVVSTDEQITVYYMQRTDNREYAYHKSAGLKDKGRIASGTLNNADNFNYWFYFTEGNEEGKYAIYNYATGLSVTANGVKLYANKESESTIDYAITLNEDYTGLVISAAEGDWYMTSSKVAELSTNASTTWILQRIRTISLTDEPLTSLTIDKAEVTLNEGESAVLTVTTAPAYATNHTVTWSSSNAAVATVDENGTVKAVAEGSATITATANDGSGLTVTCKVTVEKAAGITAASTDVSVQTQGSLIVITGLAKGTAVSVYDTAGKLIAKAIAANGEATIDTRMPVGSTVIVKVGEQNAKVQIK